MNKTTAALKLAEEALEDAYRRDEHAAARWVYEQALDAIREALVEQEKQEPVAYCCGFENTHPDGWIDCKIFRDGEFTTPLYAAPVSAKREWVDLTDDEINKLIQAWYKSNDGLFGYASAVIAAFKEKNT